MGDYVVNTYLYAQFHHDTITLFCSPQYVDSASFFGSSFCHDLCTEPDLNLFHKVLSYPNHVLHI